MLGRDAATELIFESAAPSRPASWDAAELATTFEHQMAGLREEIRQLRDDVASMQVKLMDLESARPGGADVAEEAPDVGSASRRQHRAG